MRTKNSIKNGAVSMIATIITILVTFIAQGVFIKTLGAEYLGINGLFTNILSMLAIVELGIGPAIIYNLYKPIAQKNTEKIKSLLKLYKISYYVIAFIIFVLGLLAMPCLKFVVGDIHIQDSLYLIFILFLVDIVCSYLLTYKRSILYATEKNYIIVLVHLIAVVIMNIAQILVLVFTKNYILYLYIKIIMRLLENITITLIANKKYGYIKERNVQKLDKSTISDIVLKVKGIVFHKIGGFVVLGTDNILISAFVGITAVGLYSNYVLIVTAVTTLFGQMFTAITASVGNLLVTENKEKVYNVYKNVSFINFWLTVFSSISIFCLINPFISLWVGSEYIFNIGIVIAIVLNFYIIGMRRCISVFKDAAGIYHEDRFVPLLESLINIVASLLFLKLFGLIGVFIGTFTSSLILFLYSYPKYVYVKLFNRKYMEYINYFFRTIVVTVVICAITYFITLILKLDNLYLDFIKNMVICLIVPNLLLYTLFRKRDEYKYFKELIAKLISRKSKSEDK